MINDKVLTDLGLLSFKNGYYQITDNITVDVEGDIRFDDRNSTWIARVYNVEELKVFIECMTR